MSGSRIERTARLADVAKAAGVSQGTVSNVFSRPELVRQEVREHVKAIAASIGYRGPDPRGRMLRAGKVNAIGVATSEPLSYFFDDPFARELMRGISEACDAEGSGLALVSAQNNERLAWNIESALVDGFVLLCLEGGERLVELTRQRQLPFVALALGRPDPSVSAIGVDDFIGAQRAARHLCELGHRRFGVLALEFDDGHVGPVTAAQIAVARYQTSKLRAEGYFSVLGEYGIDTSMVPVWETQSTDASTSAGLEALFAAQPYPTALLCMSDRIALVALKWLAEHRLSVPRDVSVIGFDGVPEAARSEPPLTTMAQPILEMGRRAVRAILQPTAEPERQVLETTLDVRGSTAAPLA
ncbi:LacI family DNA-binding transcriptional regulator [Devosia sp.]|uniref:LacI family DNA-binding transcriptional regulator n=1 Tax=Devosia sp. TaxID=1871048 RepID=UPI003BAA6F18